MVGEIELRRVENSNTYLWTDMWVHYSNPNGFVGRNICYLIYYDNVRYGSIVGGSATKNLPGRESFFNAKGILCINLNEIINNTFFHVEKVKGKYPLHNFVSKVVSQFRQTILNDWLMKYQDFVIGFETLVELPRTGECYKRDDWTLVGQTKGFTCKRIAGTGTDSWGGKRVWNKEDLRPKHVFCRLV